MATNVILPALGMSQDTGKIVHWLKAEGEQITKGEPLVEIETDKATVEIEAPASGLLARVSAADGDDVPVGQVIAVVLTPAEAAQEQTAPLPEPVTPLNASKAGQAITESPRLAVPPVPPTGSGLNGSGSPASAARASAVATSLLASRIAAEHHVDLSQVKAAGQRVQKADVLAYLQHQQPTDSHLQSASPKARRLAREQGKDLAEIAGTGPNGAVLSADVLAAQVAPPFIAPVPAPVVSTAESSNLAVSTVWRIMAERTTQSWNEVPHFYLAREVQAKRMIAWREYLMLERGAKEVTYTDLLIKIVALALRQHPRVNTTWNAGKLTLLEDIHVGLAVAVEEGLVVPVIHHADRLSLREIARERKELVARAREGKLRLQDISGGTFTISNLGMYGVDTFNAIINQPQAAILAVGRIAERVVPVNGQPAVRPMMALTLSCDHRAVDGARGAQFLETIADFIEEPLGLLDGV
ncbi:MAG TPA: dihydrolipoamide acetyltransferase family protein [Ktedonobacteraceae bacterium]|nr:dihydrolipoamide acetyltransferase family protein [Ktedonobacteraceae bacterium]